MTIIRIEHEDGYGMSRRKDWASDKYTIGDSWETIGMLKLHQLMPVIHEDIAGFDSTMFCAFSSMESFYKFIITDELKFLINKGYSVYAIESSFVLEGDYQVAYKKESIISKKDITDLFR
jgi:hypothetical protein